jgi:hypothetical protein
MANDGPVEKPVPEVRTAQSEPNDLVQSGLRN